MSYAANLRSAVAAVGATRLLIADAASKVGDWVLFIAVSVVVYNSAGPGALAFYSAARLVLPIVVGPWIGTVGQALSPRTVMIAADLGRAVLLFAAAALAQGGAHPWAILLLILMCTVLGAWFNPAEKRFQRDTIPPQDRASFYAVIGTTGSVAMIIAPALGGLVLAAVGSIPLLIGDAVTFVVSALLIRTIREHHEEPNGEGGGSPEQSMRAGLSLIRRDGYVRALLLTQFVACTLAGAALVLIVPIAAHLGHPSSGVGWLTSAIGVGTVVGVFLGGTLARDRRLVAGVSSIVMMCVTFGAFGFAPSFLVAVVVCAALGILANLPEPLYWSSYAERVDDAASGSFYGVVEAAIASGFSVGGLVVGTLLTTQSVPTTTALLGGLACVAVIALLPTARAWTGTCAPGNTSLREDAVA